MAFHSKIYTSVEELNTDLQTFLAFSNTRRTHQGTHNKGEHRPLSSSRLPKRPGCPVKAEASSPTAKP